LLCVSLASFFLLYTFARKGAVAMIRCTLRLLVSEAHRRQVVASLTPLIGWTRVEPGCRGCHLLADLDEPRAIVLTEEWETQGDLDHHLRSEDYRRVLEAIELSEEAPEIRFDTVETSGGFEVVEAARMP
jgi:quinol monooxygenase YgiN